MKIAQIFALTIIVSVSQMSFAKDCYQIQNEQIQLSDSLIERYFLFEQGLIEMAQDFADSESLNCATMAKLETLAKKSGFQDFKQTGDVAESMAQVLMRLQSADGPLKNLKAEWKKEIEELRASYKSGEPMKTYDQEYITTLEEMIQQAVEPSAQNVAIVRRHYQAIQDMIQR